MAAEYDEIECGVAVSGRTVSVRIQFPTEAAAQEHGATIARQLVDGHLFIEVEFTPMMGRA